MQEGIQSVLTDLVNVDRPVHTIDLGQLSDLGRTELFEFRLAWELFSADRRRELIRAMVDRAEVDIHLNFHAVLRGCLTDTDPEVRRLAIDGLWEDERPNLVGPLTILLSNDPDAAVRASAAVSLGRFVLLGELEEIPGDPAHAAEQALREAWFRPGEANEVRRRALEGLAYTNSTAVQELIQNAYYDEDALMRQSAVFSMGRTNNPRWARIVLEELGSHEPAMRFEAAQAAGEMGLKSAVQTLIRRLEDGDATVREAAAGALGKIGGPAAKRALEALIGGPDEALSQAAEDALDELNFSSESLDNLLMDVEERAVKNRAALEDLSLDEDFEDFEDDGFESELGTLEDLDDEFDLVDEFDWDDEGAAGDDDDDDEDDDDAWEDWR